MLILPPDQAWQLRPDMEVVPAESLDGRPAFLVHDPVSGAFDRVDWPESDLVDLLWSPRTLAELTAGFRAVNTLQPSGQDVGQYLAAIGTRGWLRGSFFWPGQYAEKRQPGLTVLLAKILFFQVPLLRPENFLRATAGLVRAVLNPLTFFLLFLCGAAGLYLALPRWEEYWQDSLGSFALGRLPAFLLALVLVKTLHEFSHAYAAALYGARVAGMGVAFFFFMPLPYTDVTDAWRLEWSKRLRVAAAGMAAELAVAGVSLLLWALSPPGEAAAALARLSSVAVLSTLLTNLNPGPRFDGYYVLVCLFRMENLRSRAAGELRRILWQHLLGIEMPGEEMSRRRRAALLFYACYAILYRLSLGFGLALMVYYVLPKAAGLPAAALGLWLFLGLPVLTEIRLVWRNMSRIHVTAGLLIFLLLLAGFGVWFAGSWPRRMHFPGVSRAVTEEAVRTRRSGDIIAVTAERGRRTEPEEILAVLGSPADAPALRRAEWALREAHLAEEQSWRGGLFHRDTAARAAETRRRQAELDGLRERSGYLEVHSPVAGTLTVWDNTLVPGTTVPAGAALGWVTDGAVTAVSCYPLMEDAARLEPGAAAEFFPDDGSGKIPGRIVRIDEARPQVLEDPQLAEALGALRSGNAYILPKPYARVTVQLDEELPRIGQTGRIWVWSRPESLAVRTADWLRGLAIRESAF